MSRGLMKKSMACVVQRVRRCTFATEHAVQPLVTSCEICGGRSGAGVGLSEFRVISPAAHLPPLFPTNL
jgi:hypothetical protein